MLVLTFFLAAQIAGAPAASPSTTPTTTTPPTTTATTEQLKTLVMDLATEGGVDPAAAAPLSGVLSAELSRYVALDVISNADVRRLMELEGQKQSAGCGDSSCIAEIAGAMGARLVVFGSLGTLGSKLVVHLNLYDSVKATSVGREFVEADSIDALPELLRPKLRSLLARTYQELGLNLPALDTPPPPPPVADAPATPVLPWVLVGGGAALALGGGLTSFFSSTPYFQYQAAKSDFAAALEASDAPAASDARAQAEEASTAWSNGSMQLTVVGGALVVVGIGAAAVGAAWLVAE